MTAYFRRRGAVGPHVTRQGRMPFAVSAAVGLMMLVGAAWILLPSDSRAGEAPPFRGGARLAVDTELIDLGAQPYNRVVEARFQLRNIGDRPLQLPPSPPIEVVEGC